MGAAAPALLAAQIGMQGLDAYQQYGANQDEARYSRTAGDINAKFLRLQADDALRRGDLAAGVSRRESAGILGAQKASFAGQGVDVNSGSSAAVSGEDTALAENKANDIQTNAWRAAWGYNQEANQSELEGKTRQLAYKNAARNTLLTGGASVAKDLAGFQGTGSGGRGAAARVRAAYNGGS